MVYDSHGRLSTIEMSKNGEQNTINLTYQQQNDKISNSGFAYMNESPFMAKIKRISDDFTHRTMEFEYDDSNNEKALITKDENDNVILSVTKENPFETKYTVGSTTTKTLVQYDQKGQISKFANLSENGDEQSKYTYTYEYDSLTGQVTKRTGGNSTFEYDYSYSDGSSYVSMIPRKETQIVGTLEFTSTYEYDSNLNLIKKDHTWPICNCTSYSYDELNRIYKEGHRGRNVDFTYIYNQFNRLESVLKNGLPYKTFHYDDLGRIKKLYKNNELVMEVNYSGIYPTSIKKYSVWKASVFKQDGKLVAYKDTLYAYDMNGFRISKTVNGKTTKYYYVGDRLLGEDLPDGSNVRYVYDQREIVGARHYKNGTILEYEYIKDNTGSVIAVVRDSKILATYEYDAWGNIIEKHCVIDDQFAEINPIRYKSYYCDIDTGFYYLQSRYYEPEFGAFISPDSVNYLDIQNVGGLNLYAYCKNNPVMYVDPNGNIAISKSSSFNYSKSITKKRSIDYYAQNLVSLNSLPNNYFGDEYRMTTEWEAFHSLYTSQWFRIGFFVHHTTTIGKAGSIYSFSGVTTDVMNAFGETAFVGFGINLFDGNGAEIQLENFGIGVKCRFGVFSLSLNVNLFGATSFTAGIDHDMGNGNTDTYAFTISSNTFILMVMIVLIYVTKTTGIQIPGSTQVPVQVPA